MEEEPYPSLGADVIDFIETNLVFGPGDLRGMPAKVDPEKRALIYRAYEVYPYGHPQAGRRRFRRVAISLRKGSAKTEFAAWIAACELHPGGPVRVSGFDGRGQPIGIGVTDPSLFLCAYTEEQSEDLAYGALKAILELSRIRDDFDIGLERILRRGGDGKAVAVSTSPDARDGARTTWQHFDETHRFTLPRLKNAHRTMLANLPKRRLTDPWALETTTAPAPGEGSVAESTMEYAKSVAMGERDDARLFFFHRQAGTNEPIDLTTKDKIREAVLDASGPVAEWSDIEGIIDQWDDPTADRAYLERVWLNREVQSEDKAFDSKVWATLASPDVVIPDGDLITLGFDGARNFDSTGIVATHVETGYQWVIGVWERPFNAAPGWEVPIQQVTDAMTEAFRRWDVWRLYADPPYWDTLIGTWAGQWGEKRVIAWDTKRGKQMCETILAFKNAIVNTDLSHDGNRQFANHIGNSCKRLIGLVDERGVKLWVIQKERPDSPHKIDLAMAGALSWRARLDALALGATGGRSVYEIHGVRTVG